MPDGGQRISNLANRTIIEFCPELVPAVPSHGRSFRKAVVGDIVQCGQLHPRQTRVVDGRRTIRRCWRTPMKCDRLRHHRAHATTTPARATSRSTSSAPKRRHCRRDLEGIACDVPLCRDFLKVAEGLRFYSQFEVGRTGESTVNNGGIGKRKPLRARDLAIRHLQVVNKLDLTVRSGSLADPRA